MVVKKDTTVKIKEEIADKIDKIILDKTLKYKSRSDFILQAIEKEIEYSKMIKNLHPLQRWRFRDLWNSKKWTIYDECLDVSMRLGKYDEEIDKQEKSIKK